MTDYTNTVAKSGNVSIQVCEKPDGPPPSYSRDASTDSVVADGIMNYGSTATAVHVEPGNSTQPLLTSDDQFAPSYQEAVFSRFVCIFFLFGCCVLFGIISTSLDGAMTVLSLTSNDPTQIYAVSTYLTGFMKASLILSSFVPLLSCCCCLGTRSPRHNFCCGVTFYISFAIIGSLLFITMLGELLFSWSAIVTFNSTGYDGVIRGSTMGYAYALTFANFLAIIFSLVMTVTAIRACVKDPERNCSNQFIGVCVYIKFLLISGFLAFLIAVAPAIITLITIPCGYNSMEYPPSQCGYPPQGVPNLPLYTYSLVAISCSGLYLILLFLLVFLVGPLVCILEVRDSPLFSSVLKYIMTLSWIMSFALFANGVVLAVCSHLSPEISNQPIVASLRPSVVVTIFALSAVANLIIFIIITVIWFLSTCGSCVHAIVLCCCLFHNITSNNNF